MQNLQSLEIQVLIDMIIKKSTQYAAQLKTRTGAVNKQYEKEISLMATEIISRKTNDRNK